MRNAKTLDTLAAKLKAKAPTITACAGDTADRVGKAAKRIDAEAALYATHTKSLKQAVKAVQASVVDKTVADAQALFDSTDGKAADEATCTALKEAIGKCDTKAITDATSKVNVSVKAKADAGQRMPPPKRPPRLPRRRRSRILVPPLRRLGAPPDRLIAVRQVRQPAADPAVPPVRPVGRQDSRVQAARQIAAVLTVNTVSLAIPVDVKQSRFPATE